MEKESQLVAEIKKKHPPLKGVIPIFKKYGYDIRDANSKAIFLKHNLIKYLKKDKQLVSIHKKSVADISLAYKEMRTLGRPMRPKRTRKYRR
jgi:hypothetical protein